LAVYCGIGGRDWAAAGRRDSIIMAGIRGRTGAARGFLAILTGAAGVISQFRAILLLTTFVLCGKMDLTGTAEPDGTQGQQSNGSAPDGRAAGRVQSRGGRTLCGRKREADGRRNIDG
jgi:hypothetical protein